MKSEKSFSIGRQISFLFGVLFIAFSVVLIFYFAFYAKESIRNSLNRYEDESYGIARDVESFFDSVENQLEWLASDSGDTSYWNTSEPYNRKLFFDRLSSRIRSLMRMTDGLDAVVMVQRNSDVIIESHKMDNTDFILLMNDFNGHSTTLPIAPVVRFLSDGNKAEIVFSRPVVSYTTDDRYSKTPAYVYGAVGIDSILPQDMDCMICCLCTIENDELTILSKRGSQAQTLTDSEIRSVFKAKGTIFDINNRKCFCSIGKLDRAGLFIVLFQPLSSIIWDVIKVVLIGLAVLIVLLMIGVYGTRIIRRRLMKPLDVIVDETNTIKNGDFKHRIQKSQASEFSVISDSFNMVLDEIENSNGIVIDQQRKLYELELMNRETQIKGLQSQINPHFLYNTLECIRSISRFNNVPSISEIVSGMSDIYRYSASFSEGTLETELECIRSYATIMNIRYESRIEFDIADGTMIKDCHMPKMILQPIVENAITHGIAPLQMHGRIGVDVSMNENTVTVRISDNGVGIDHDKLEELTSKLQNGIMTEHNSHNIGLYNVHMRLRNEFGLEYGVSIESEEGKGTVVFMTLPYTIKEDRS